MGNRYANAGQNLAKKRAEHETYIARIKDAGEPIIEYEPPCGCAAIETPAPPKGQVWDSLSTCPTCGDMHFKVVHHNRAEASRP